MNNQTRIPEEELRFAGVSWQPAPGILDTEEQVRDLQTQLIKASEEPLRKLKRASRESQKKAFGYILP